MVAKPANSLNLSQAAGVVSWDGTATTSTSSINQYSMIVGSTSQGVANIAPSATAGVPLVSNGGAANPSFSTALVAGGGTAAVSFNINGAVYSNTTTTGALAAATLADGQVLVGSSIGAPIAATITAGTGIAVTNGHNTISIATTGTTFLTVTPVNHAATPYTVLTTDDFLAVDVTAGVVSIKLPNAPTTGRVYYIKDSVGKASTSNITVTTVGGAVTIDGVTSYLINTNFGAISVIFDGTSYEVF